MPDRFPSRLKAAAAMSMASPTALPNSLKSAVVLACLGQLEQPPFGVLDLHVGQHVDRSIVGDVDHVLADADQAAAGREVVDRAPVVFGVDDGGRFHRQPGEIVGNRHLADLFLRRAGRF